jgi:hypothetical protein
VKLREQVQHKSYTNFVSLPGVLVVESMAHPKRAKTAQVVVEIMALVIQAFIAPRLSW